MVAVGLVQAELVALDEAPARAARQRRACSAIRQAGARRSDVLPGLRLERGTAWSR
jgi:hypothetical protein